MLVLLYRTRLALGCRRCRSMVPRDQWIVKWLVLQGIPDPPRGTVTVYSLGKGRLSPKTPAALPSPSPNSLLHDTRECRRAKNAWMQIESCPGVYACLASRVESIDDTQENYCPYASRRE